MDIASGSDDIASEGWSVHSKPCGPSIRASSWRARGGMLAAVTSTSSDAVRAVVVVNPVAV